MVTSIESSKDEIISEPSSSTKKPPPHVSIAAIVGGMSAQKQRRIIDRGVDVMVATPGRLWDILEDVGLGTIKLTMVFNCSSLRMINWHKRFEISDFWFSMRRIGWLKLGISPSWRTFSA